MLNTHYGNVKNWEEIFLNEEGHSNGLDFNIGLLCIGIGMNKITPKNLDKFVERARVWQNAVGPLAQVGPRAMYVEKEDIEMLIGFDCNASTLTNVEFRNKVYRVLLSDKITIWDDEKDEKIFLRDYLAG